ncbi:hypothetical protein D1007_27836 [Hordeum vulgare]|nr:hypothetical protein D1007_27836 [Hordeum vulgare]
MDTPPAAASGGEGKAKHVRKRSRYLDHHYQTPTLLNALHGGGGGHHTPPPPPPPTDLLVALHQAAACPYDLPVPLPGGVDAGALLTFFALHRDSASASAPATDRGKAKDTTTSISSSSSSSSPRPNPCRAMALAPTHGSAANAHAMEQPAGPANAPPLPPPVGGGAAGPKNKKPTANSSPKQAQHSGKPVALILHFAADHQPLPTKEQLHSTPTLMLTEPPTLMRDYAPTDKEAAPGLGERVHRGGCEGGGGGERSGDGDRRGKWRACRITKLLEHLHEAVQDEERVIRHPRLDPVAGVLRSVSPVGGEVEPA